MTSALIPTLIVGGVAYELVTHTGNPIPSPGPDYTTASSPGQPLPGAVSFARTIKNRYGGGSYMPQNMVTWDKPTDPELQKKFDTIEAAAAKAYSDADAVAKAKAADALNKDLKLDPPLTGHEDWKTVSAVVGGATGGAVGGFIGGPIGAKLGALAGAYLGVKLEDLIEKNWDELEGWVKGKWGDVKDFAEDAYDEVAGLWPF